MGDTAAATTMEAIGTVAPHLLTLAASPSVTAMAIGIVDVTGINGVMIVTARATETIAAIITVIGIMTGTPTMVGAETIPDRFPGELESLGTGPKLLKGKQMNKDHIKGAVDLAKGSMKQVVGAACCDTKLKVEGAVEKAKGKLESAVGDAKDALRKL
jgi:uncharacterized protein YjbJ (UPF0337 family)